MTQASAQPRDRQIAILLQQALSHLTRNEFSAAEALLRRALSVQPDDADTLHLFGQMRWVQKRFGEAETFYRKALAVSPQRAEAHCHLGQTLHAMGRFDEAAASFREALRLKPDLADAHFGLGLSLAEQKDFTAAENAYRAGLAQTRDPRHAAALKHNLGILLSQQHRHDEALAEYDGAQKLVPTLPRADYNRANTLQMMGKLDEAEAGYRKAIARDPLDVKAHSDLNHLLYRLGREDFLQSFSEAARRFPPNAALLAEQGKFLFLSDHLEEAREAFSRALALAPDNAAARDGLGSVLTRLRRYGDASREYERLLMSGAATVEMRCNFVECLLRAGDPAKSIAISEQTLARAPHHQLALALWGIGLRQSEDAREEALNDYENFVGVYDLDPPEEFSGMEDFNEALNTYLARLHVDRREHINQTSRFGTKTHGALFGVGHEVVERLRERIDGAIADYIARMKENEKHPLLGRRAGGFLYSGSWSTRLSDCGFHTNHVHPTGWLSSAYYVALPDVVADEAGKQGWIKFGEPSFDAKFAEPVRRIVQPQPGRLVLFPSYMWHGTVPFRSQDVRTTVAFDVVPSAQ